MENLLELLKIAKGVTCHSGQTCPGDVFVAICGRKTDGNRYAAEATAHGAAAVVTDQLHNLPPLPIPVYVVPDARRALSYLAAHFYGQPSWRLAVTGVTGSNGKTTITFMLEHIFRHSGLLPGLIGTVRVNTGRNCFPSTLTTPDAVSIQRFLAQMCQNGVTHAAMEVSAQGIEMHRVDDVKFTCGILSNICADHLDFHHDFASYLSAKRQFLNLLGPGVPLVVNIDDSYCRQILTDHLGPILTASLAESADLTAKILHMTVYGSKTLLTLHRQLESVSGRIFPAAQLRLNLPIPGRHNIENALLAIAAAAINDIPPHDAAAALASFHGVERRLDIYRMAGLTVIDDTALNPGSIDAVFEAIKNFRYRRMIVVNAIRGQRGPAINQLNAAALTHWQRELGFHLIITASNDTVGAADKVTLEEQKAFLHELEQTGTDYSFTANLGAAISKALLTAAPGDLLVLLGAQGMDAGRQVLTQELANAPVQPIAAPQAAISV